MIPIFPVGRRDKITFVTGLVTTLGLIVVDEIRKAIHKLTR